MLASDFQQYQFHSDTETGPVVSAGYPIPKLLGGSKDKDTDWIIPLGLVWGAASASSNDDVVSDGIVGGGGISGGCNWSSNMFPMSEFERLLTSVMGTNASIKNKQRTKKNYKTK
jgi:hypothetical protein